MLPGTRSFWGILLAGGLLLGGCTGAQPATPGATEGPDAEAAYRAAIRDAETAAVDEISTALTPITPSNDALIRRTTDAERELLVVTWGNATSLDGAPGDTISPAAEVWVTVAPQVHAFCASLDRTGPALALRLNQLLGLPPDSGYDRFYALWIDPTDLFRPCPDPEISDQECERAFPTSSQFLTIAPSHKTWFRRMRASMYGPDGYPWTRLGYTYDWNPTSDEVGLSEFVIRPEATVEIEAITATAAYCQSGE